MVAKREFCITKDPYAYDETLIDGFAITPGYRAGVVEATEAQTATQDFIRYPNYPTYADTPSFVTLRLANHTDSPNRSTIKETATDSAAAASLFGGVYNLTGNLGGAWRGWDFHLSGFLEGALGYQGDIPDAPALPNQAATGKRYELSMVPATLAIKVVDEAAKTSTGSRGTTTIYRGASLSQFEVSLAAKKYTEFTAQFIARRPEVYDRPHNTNSAISGDPAIFYNAVLTWQPEGGATVPFKCSEFRMSIGRTIDTDSYLCGSQFLGDLLFNGETELGGSITLAGSDWDKMRAMIAGSNDDTVNTLDQGKIEYFGEVNADPALSTVLANDIPSGKFTITLHTPNGKRVVTKFTVDTAKLTEASREAQGQNRLNKTVNWTGLINSTSHFYVDVYPPA
jgi:hypothetical protein